MATKFHIGKTEVENRADTALYNGIRYHLESSMKRLKTDYVDLYYLHRLHELVPVEEVAEVMGRLIEEGLIRGWGLSQVSLETLQKAQETVPVSAVQNLYSMVDWCGCVFPDCQRFAVRESDG